jgi:hypothetical protein
VLVKYNLTTDIEQTTDNSVAFSSNNIMTYLVVKNEDITNKENPDPPCDPIVFTMCNYGGTEHCAGVNCGSTYPVNYYPCVDNNSGGTSNTGYTYGYDYTTGSNNNTPYTGVGQTYGSGGAYTYGNPIIINVVPPCHTCPEIYDADFETPCEKVKNQFTDNLTLQNKLDILSGNTSASTERGILKLSNSSIIQNAAIGADGSVEMPSCTKWGNMYNDGTYP